jgi:hypothetical protein
LNDALPLVIDHCRAAIIERFFACEAGDRGKLGQSRQSVEPTRMRGIDLERGGERRVVGR